MWKQGRKILETRKKRVMETREKSGNKGEKSHGNNGEKSHGNKGGELWKEVSKTVTMENRVKKKSRRK